jgi:hypothetical protein
MIELLVVTITVPRLSLLLVMGHRPVTSTVPLLGLLAGMGHRQQAPTRAIPD